MLYNCSKKKRLRCGHLSFKYRNELTTISAISVDYQLSKGHLYSLRITAFTAISSLLNLVLDLIADMRTILLISLRTVSVTFA